MCGSTGGNDVGSSTIRPPSRFVGWNPERTPTDSTDGQKKIEKQELTVGTGVKTHIVVV